MSRSEPNEGTMMAAVVHKAGGPEALKLERRPIPKPEKGQVLIRIKAFGLNRAEMFTRQGHSPVQFPRVLGIEATGIVEEAPGSEDRLQKGHIVGTVMGGMGRAFDGGYAEYTCVPASQGALFQTLQIKQNDRLLIRGGTSSIGLAAAAIAKQHGVFVAATTRKPEREGMLRANGADHVLIDNGTLADQVKQIGKFDKVLELVGTSTMDDSLQCVGAGGIVSMVGIVGGKWTVDEGWGPSASIPTGVFLTAYHSSTEAFMKTPLDEIVEQLGIEALKRLIGKTFHGLDKIVEAHEWMDDSRAGGKIVMVLDSDR